MNYYDAFFRAISLQASGKIMRPKTFSAAMWIVDIAVAIGAAYAICMVRKFKGTLETHTQRERENGVEDEINGGSGRG